MHPFAYAPEEGLHVSRSPPGGSGRHPLLHVIIRRQKGDARIVRTAAPEHLGTRVADAPVSARLGLDGVIKVIFAFEQVRPAHQFEDARVCHIGWAGLE